MTFENLQNEAIFALKNKDKFRRETISALVGAVKNLAINKGCRENIPEEIVNEALLKEQKTINEMIETCPATRTDLLQIYNAKKEIIDSFAPKLLSDEAEISKFILSLGIEISKANRGNIMKALKGKVDMKVANKVLASMM